MSKWLLIFSLIFFLNGCGNPGALYLPAKTKDTHKTPPKTPPTVPHSPEKSTM